MSLREQGFDHAAIVMLGGLGAGSNERWLQFKFLFAGENQVIYAVVA